MISACSLRATDAWHLAAVAVTVPRLAEPEPQAFATRDRAQRDIAEQLGFVGL